MAETRIPLQACAFVGWLTLSSTEHDLLINRYISPSNRKPTFAMICQFKLVLSLPKLQLVVTMVDIIIVTQKVLVNPNATELTLHPMLLYLCKRVLLFSDNRNERSFFSLFSSNPSRIRRKKLEFYDFPKQLVPLEKHTFHSCGCFFISFLSLNFLIEREKRMTFLKEIK